MLTFHNSKLHRVNHLCDELLSFVYLTLAFIFRKKRQTCFPFISWVVSMSHKLTLLSYFKVCKQRKWSNLELRVESHPILHRFSLTSGVDWSKKFAPPSRPITCKTQTIRDALGSLLVFTLISHWFLVIFFGFRFIRRSSCIDEISHPCRWPFS